MNGTMPLHRRLAAWVVTDRMGQILTMSVTLAWGLLWWTKTRFADWAEARFAKY